MRSRLVALIHVVFSFHTMWAQLQVQPVPGSRLERLAQEQQLHFSRQKERAKAYAQSNRIPLSYVDVNGNRVILVGVDAFGFPVYRTTLTAESLRTTGTNTLHSGGKLGLDLKGEGITVGIWDDGMVGNHVEFSDRVVTKQGTIDRPHATHVTGIILSSGLNTSAKGMAPKAIGATWDFENDIVEMAALAKPGQQSLLFSNHSYGTILGWFRNSVGNLVWAGNPSISSAEDYRFGFYSFDSQILDQLLYDAPYYTVVWASGNDRSEFGDNSFPADGNGGSGFDCLGPEGVAKNNITVGAVSKVDDYTGPSSVLMSGFSSWGPTDDGRIKPDLVGVGVSVLSTTGLDAYAYNSGTSMAAPNVTGSLILLQELYHKLHSGTYMRAATLKALAIHTAKEAGVYPGPDYSFGWGLLDVQAAAQVLLDEDNRGVRVQELTLENGHSLEIPIELKANTKVTATIVWTDPAGSPVKAILDPTDLMLVNDLDLRLIDNSGKQYFPWTLDPVNPSHGANKGDNFRDNVEKIEFVSATSTSYKVRISHKATLTTGQQHVSLILTYTPSANATNTLYWIGGSGNWNDPLNWSITSGGSSANQVPNELTRVIFDNNSFLADGNQVILNRDVSCSSLLWLATRRAGLSLNSHSVHVDGSIKVMSDQFYIATPGTLSLRGDHNQDNYLAMANAETSKADLVIHSARGSKWTLRGTANLNTIDLQQGVLNAPGATIKVNGLIVSSSHEKTMNITGAKIIGARLMSLNANLQLVTDATTSVICSATDSVVLNMPRVVFKGSITGDEAPITVTGEAIINAFTFKKDLYLMGANNISEMTADGGAHLNIQENTQQSFGQLSLINACAPLPVQITAMNDSKASIKFTEHFKACFDYVNIKGVDVVGQAVINTGVHSSLLHADNWRSGDCDDILFADFSVKYDCEGSIAEFTDLSEGNATSWEWTFSSGSSVTKSYHQNAHYYVSNDALLNVALTISDGMHHQTYEKMVDIKQNTLSDNKIVLSGNKFMSVQTAPYYEWWRNEQKLTGENNRSLIYQGDPGAYFVVIADEYCNIPSDPFIISATVQELNENRISVFPNPAEEWVKIELPPDYLPARLVLLDAVGSSVVTSVQNDIIAQISLKNLATGVYVLQVFTDDGFTRKKLIVKK